MGFSIGLSQGDIGFARSLNELRKAHTKNHKPAHRKDGDLVGCLAEVAGCKAWGFPYTVLGYDYGGGGDGGKDLVFPNGLRIDIKSSADHAGSWLIKYPRCSGDNKRADWYVFAFVEVPYHVHFLGKQSCEFVSTIPLFKPVKGARRIFLSQVLPVSMDDFLGD